MGTQDIRQFLTLATDAKFLCNQARHWSVEAEMELQVPAHYASISLQCNLRTHREKVWVPDGTLFPM
jgi:hypothetical protein